MEHPQINDFTNLFINDTPLLDVRAPVEFQQGALPFTCNIPLLNNEEREAIGIRYKTSGQQEAIELGKQLISGDSKDQRIQQWTEFARQHPNGALYCFRGGLRSKVCQQWIFEDAGISYPRITGGYKALRRFLITELESVPQHFLPVILGGRTGVGKTCLLHQLQNKIDLEALFHHRGSAFGMHVSQQPRQIDIENSLAVNLLKLRSKGVSRILMEDEAPNIGSRRLPDSIVELLQKSPLIMLEAPLEERVKNVVDEYLTDSLQEYESELGNDAGLDAWAANLRASLNKIQKRLGGQRFNKCSDLMTLAIEQFQTSGETVLFEEGIRLLLKDYYDPMYDYQLTKKQHRVIFRGYANETLDFLAAEQKII